MTKGHLRFDFSAKHIVGLNRQNNFNKLAVSRKNRAIKKLQAQLKKGLISTLEVIEGNNECLITWTIGVDW